MPIQPCPNQSQGSQIIGQTLFLGASVNSFNTSMGWSGQPSQLTVTLVEDSATRGCIIPGGVSPEGLTISGQVAAQFPTGPNDNGQLKPAQDTDRFLINHYHTCTGDSCYVTSKGNPYNSYANGSPPPGYDPNDKMVPGKVYYEFINGGGGLGPNSETQVAGSFVSKYWYNPDPGFFGRPNRINPDNSYVVRWQLDNLNLNKGYDIIDTPVFFRVRDFTFGGLVQSWTRQIGQGGNVYTVTINSMQALLNNCYIIIGSYAGAIYSKLENSTPRGITPSQNSLFAGPRNYTGHRGVEYYGRIHEGNIPNVFNIYGFLESFGLDGFGGSKFTTEGISANLIVDALSALTSSTDSGQLLTFHNTAPEFNDYGKRTAFSPFGRILSKCMQENDTYTPINTTFKRFGVIPPTPVLQEEVTPSNRCQFLLDLSEIPRLPNDFRISGPVITITDLLNTLAEQAGFDYYVDLVPVGVNGVIHNIIKVKTISRLAQPRQNEIENTVKVFECNQYPISSSTIGKEKNETSARAIIIGGKVQRLYQAKSYRLAYTQSNYIYDPRQDRFIDYMQLGKIGADFSRTIGNGIERQFHHGKVRIPSSKDLHNPELASIINPGYTGIYTHNDEIKNLARESTFPARFSDPDEDWTDNKELKNNVTGKAAGNYNIAKIVKQESSDTSTWGLAYQQRFFPLFKDVICPFFGFVMENELDIQTDGSNNDFRRVRPVWFDTWTGQIVILLRVEEIPLTAINLENVYSIAGVEYFILTESEIRAALTGFDEFLVYCLCKTYKTDLVEMLRRAYILNTKNQYMYEGIQDPEATQRASEKHNWYWKLLTDGYTSGGNIAGDYFQTVNPVPDKVDGNHSIDQNALRDLQILHSFVAEIGKYYGKKYMVTAPYIAAYRDDKFADIILPTAAGNAYVFSGGGDLHYSYNPTNDGAWEEYGNIIDDCIAAGGKDWYTLSDEMGKIKPLLGYNANDMFDFKRYEVCMLDQNNFNKFKMDKLNPYWSFQAWDIMKERRDSSCGNRQDFIYPSIDYSSLTPSEYALITVSGVQANGLPSIYNQFGITPTTNPVAPTAPTITFTKSQARDAYGEAIGNLEMKKLFVTTKVEESFIFLDPVKLREPRILVDAPGLPLNSSSDEFAKDPNRTIIANVAMEDLSIYMHSTNNGSSRDKRWINNMLSYIYTVTNDPGFTVGNQNNSANKSAAYAQLSPKMAHPFFVGIPLRSNVDNYGPWTNYPYIEYLVKPSSVFPSGYSVSQSDDFPRVCTSSLIEVNSVQARNAVDNWILPTNVEVVEDYTPWNYGGMAFLDSVAINDARSRTNYQNVIETAQVDMAGLPLFNLGGTFSFGNFGSIPTGVRITGIPFTDVKYIVSSLIPNLGNVGYPALFEGLLPTTGSQTITYQVLQLKSSPNAIGGPVITNIQTSVNEQGAITTYSFRTYSRKLGFFNKENSDRVKQMHLDSIRRNKQLSQITQQTLNNINNQTRKLQEQRLSSSNFSSKDFRSKLFGWSPVKVLVGQAYPYLGLLEKTPTIHTGIFYSSTGVSRLNDNVTSFKIKYGKDIGDNIDRWKAPQQYLIDGLTIPSLSIEARHRTDIGIFEEKEINAQIDQNYGLQSMMSLDGIFSPVSFYPTLKNSTYNFGLYDRTNCPFCSGTKKITVEYQKYVSQGYGTSGTYKIYCNKCTTKENKLNIKLKSNITSSSASQSLESLPPYIVTSGTDLNTLLEFEASNNSAISVTTTTSTSSSSQAGVSIPINMVSLQPIVVPYGEFKNPNVQNYIGVHPEGSGIHGDLSIGPFNSANPRTFYDRCRHSIEIVGRGAITPKSINIAQNLRNYTSIGPNEEDRINADYYDMDVRLNSELTKRGDAPPVPFVNNQRFMSFRGPLVLHGWGYDLEGYPIPNAADEPYELDNFGRPRRFKVKMQDGYPKNVKYKDLSVGDIFKYNQFEYVKEKIPANDTENFEIAPGVQINNNATVSHEIYEDNLTDPGGFPNDTAINAGDRLNDYQGSIISKTQKYENGKWTAKKKLKQFYLNWAERPDLWPIGPIDLRWDEGRKVWATKSDSVSSIYKMVYAVLEEDLVKDNDMDETYPARAFLDDVEYSTEPLPDGFRRLIFIKDKGGYTAPRGAKLLCRYNKDTGFYEPISKQSFVTKGLIGNGNTATIDLSYIPGRKKGEPVPTMLVTFENPFEFNIISGNKGLFTFMNGKWTITATKETE